MTGVITLRHVLAHAPLVIREFGFSVLWYSLIAAITGQRTTFLAIVAQHAR